MLYLRIAQSALGLAVHCDPRRLILSGRLCPAVGRVQTKGADDVHLAIQK